jgi:hypothetical protein
LFVGVGYAKEEDPGTLLQVTVTPQSDVLKLGEYVTVNFDVKNISKRQIEMRDWSCSTWLAWQTNTEWLEILSGSCDKNFPIYRTLKPGESYTGGIGIRVRKEYADFVKQEDDNFGFSLGYRTYIKKQNERKTPLRPSVETVFWTPVKVKLVPHTTKK